MMTYNLVGIWQYEVAKDGDVVGMIVGESFFPSDIEKLNGEELNEVADFMEIFKQPRRAH